VVYLFLRAAPPKIGDAMTALYGQDPTTDKMNRSFVTPEGVDLNLALGDAGQRAAAFLIDIAIMVSVLLGFTLIAFLAGAGSYSEFGAAFTSSFLNYRPKQQRRGKGCLAYVLRRAMADGCKRSQFWHAMRCANLRFSSRSQLLQRARMAVGPRAGCIC
jgi:hypothetical protein